MAFADLEAAIREFIDTRNEKPNAFVWTKWSDEILAKIARFAHRTMNLQAAQEYIARTDLTEH